MRLLFALLVFAGAGLLGACGAFREPAAPPRPTPAQPYWNDALLAEHLRFFNGASAGGRATGTPGFGLAASYAAARLAEFELQPGLAGGFRTPFAFRLNQVRRASLRAVGPADSLVLAPLADFVADGRSDSGSVSATGLLLAPDALSEAPPAAYDAATPELALLPAGGRLLVLPARGLVAARVSAAALRRLVGPVEPGGEGQWRTVDLARTVTLAVESAYDAAAVGFNVLGYVPGKHPSHSDTLVIVAADLDAVGEPTGQRLVDLEHFGIEAAAVLELARNYSFFGQRSTVPEASILFALFSGARLGQRGLEAYLRDPLWPLPATRAILLVGEGLRLRPSTADSLGRLGTRILRVTVPRPDTLFGPGQVYVPQTPGGTASESGPPRLDYGEVVARATAQARAYLAATHAALLPLVVSPGPALPLGRLETPAATLP